LASCSWEQEANRLAFSSVEAADDDFTKLSALPEPKQANGAGDPRRF
jgi:hypothetical protein